MPREKKKLGNHALPNRASATAPLADQNTHKHQPTEPVTQQPHPSQRSAAAEAGEDPAWSPDDLIAEWASLLDSLCGPISWPPVLIVTSNGIARFVLDAVIKVQCELDSIKLKTGAYGLIRSDADGATLLDWNVRP